MYASNLTSKIDSEKYISPYSVRMRENAAQNNSEYGHVLLNE